MRKKILFFILLLTLSYSNIIQAKTVSDVACDYKVKTVTGDVMTDLQIQIIGYNDGAGGSLNIYYKDTNGKYVSYDGPTYDWQNYGNTDSYPTAMLRIFTTDKKGKTYIANYKKSSKCPVIYSNTSSDGSTIDVENHVLNTELIEATSEKLEASYERLRTTNGDWEKREDFYRDDTGETTVKDDLVCTYSMKFDMYNITAPVEFRTIYNAANGSKTYRVSVNGSGYDYTTLNEEVFLMLGQGGSELVYISSEQLKKIILDGKCLERNKVYHYYDLSHSRYVITADEQEAKDNGVAGRYDDGNEPEPGQNTNNPGVNIQKPDLDIIDGTTTCESLLGEGLTKVLRFAINAIRIIAVIATIALSMVRFIPAVSKGDQAELNKAIKTTIWSAVILIIIVMLPTLLRVIGKLFGFDTSCI